MGFHVKENKKGKILIMKMLEIPAQKKRKIKFKKKKSSLEIPWIVIF